MMRAAALLLCLSALVHAQPKPAEPLDTGLVLRFETHLVQVDAVVLDKDGRRVPDLAATDFTVLQDGKPRPISRFSYVPALSGGEVIVLLDDLNMDAAAFGSARESLAHFAGPVTVVCLSRRSGAHLDRAMANIYWRAPVPVTSLLGDIPLVREMRDILVGLGARPGRKSLVVVSPSASGARSLDVRAMSDLANRTSTTIYSLARSESLTALSAATAGWSIHDFQEAGGPAPYYLIGWDPGEGVFEEEGKRTAEYHRLQIRVRDKKLQVHTREGFLPRLGTPPAPDVPSVAEQMRRALVAPVGGGDLDVTLTAGFVRQEAAGSSLDLLLHIGTKGLRLEPAGDGCSVARLEVMRALWPLDPGLAPSERVTTQPLEVPVCGTSGIVVTVRDRVPSPGAYQARVAVRNLDHRTGVIPIGSAAQYLVVPNLAKEPLALSVPTVWSGEMPPPPTGDLTGAPARETHPAVRRIPAGGNLRYAVQVFGSADDLRVRILRDAQEVSSTGGAPSGSIPLTGLTPGRYVLQISATRKSRPDRAEQYLDFEIY